MHNGDDFIKRLREDKQYREALGRCKTPAERKAVATFVETFVGTVGNIMGPVIERAEQDPEFAKRLAMALAEHKPVLSNSQTPTSGSNV